MAVDLAAVSVAELDQDLADALHDIGLCDLALHMGVTEYHGGDVRERREANRAIADRILAELERRRLAYGS